jgi:hypothetical protein
MEGVRDEDERVWREAEEKRRPREAKTETTLVEIDGRVVEKEVREVKKLVEAGAGGRGGGMGGGFP